MSPPPLEMGKQLMIGSLFFHLCQPLPTFCQMTNYWQMSRKRKSHLGVKSNPPVQCIFVF